MDVVCRQLEEFGVTPSGQEPIISEEHSEITERIRLLAQELQAEWATQVTDENDD
jgi:hypothetical protein